MNYNWRKLKYMTTLFYLSIFKMLYKTIVMKFKNFKKADLSFKVYFYAKFYNFFNN